MTDTETRKWAMDQAIGLYKSLPWILRVRLDKPTNRILGLAHALYVYVSFGSLPTSVGAHFKTDEGAGILRTIEAMGAPAKDVA